MFYLKNCAPFSTCKTEINYVFIHEANHIYIAMPMYNVIEHSDNSSKLIIHWKICDSLKQMKFQLIMLI